MNEGTRQYIFLEEDGSATVINCVGNDTNGATTDRDVGVTAGLWDANRYEWGYGLGIKVSGNDWRLVGGSISFPSSTAMPIVLESDEIDTFTFSGGAPTIRPGFWSSVSYQCTPGGETLQGAWSKSFNVSSPETFNRRFIRIGGSVYFVTEAFSTPVLSANNVALIATVGSDKVFRIYDSSGVVYSDTHATRWNDASVMCASDRWFYVSLVKDWSGYANVEPSAVFGSPPTYIHMLISMDGSKRVRVCQYDELNSRYSNVIGSPTPTVGQMPTIGSGPVSIVPQTDCVKISGSVNYALPATISYPEP